MSDPYQLNDMLDFLITKFKAISTDSGYNFTMKNDYVQKKFELIQEAAGYPFICLGSSHMTGSEQTDQVRYDSPLSIEWFGYTDSSTDPVTEAVKLAADMEKAIYVDESLDDNVWGLGISYDITSFEANGICVLTLTATGVHTKT